MGLQIGLEAEGYLLPHDLRKGQSATGQIPQSIDLQDDSDPMRAARGTVIAVVLGSILWAAILWALL